jgi:hypothetical protein
MQRHENEATSERVAAKSSHQRAGGEGESATVTVARAIAEGRSNALNPMALLHLQRSAGNSSTASLLGEDQTDEGSPVKDVVGSGGGVPLDQPTRNFIEEGLGHDFGDVRVHTDAKATESAKSLNAQAYTVGTDVVFQGDKYTPESSDGKRVLAHELTHVVQQKSGPVDGTPAAGGISVSDPSDRFEQAAGANAERVMSSPSGSAESTSAPAAAQTSVQRVGPEEEVKEEDSGGVAAREVQRADEEETEE